MEKVIRITGKATLSVKPDTTVVGVSIFTIKKEYDSTLEENLKKVNKIKKLILNLGVKEDNIRTSDFSIDIYKEWKELTKKYKQEGYKCSQRLIVEFPNDNDLLGKILYQLSKCDVDPELSIHFKIKNPDIVKKELLVRAVEVAKEKAEILAAASSVELKEIIDINYSFSSVIIESRPIRMAKMSSEIASDKALSRCDVDINPEDINVSDNVTITWRIE